MVGFISLFTSSVIFRRPAIVFLIISALMLGTADCVPIDAQVSPYHLDEAHRERIDSALEKAAEWLASHQRENGTFQSEMADGVPLLPLTAMALWALSEAGGAKTHSGACQTAAAYLLSFQQEDGGVYEPQQGLVRYTAAVARQGLVAWGKARKDTSPHDDAAWRQAMDRLNLFVYRHRNLESLADEDVRSTPGQVTADVERLIQGENLSEEIKEALAFLLARTLGIVGRPELKTLDGKRHDWAKELGDCLLGRQKSEGFWVNENQRWFESDPVLVTCYAMVSLSICHDVKRQRK